MNKKRQQTYYWGLEYMFQKIKHWKNRAMKICKMKETLFITLSIGNGMLNQITWIIKKQRQNTNNSFD